MNEEMLHAYLDGELSPEETSRVEEALATDTRLAAEYERLVAMHESLGLLESIPSTAEAASILRLDRRRRRGRIFRIAAPLVTAAAALLFILVPGRHEMPSEASVFSLEEQVQYVYWEADSETYGSGDLNALEGEILAALEPS